MSASNGVIRIGRKGIKKFAFGDDGPVFEVDVVVAMQGWIAVDESFRQMEGEHKGEILTEDMSRYHQAAVDFVEELAGAEYSGKLSKAEALDFIARLSEQHTELVDFFRPRKRERPESQDTSGAELVFSEEGAPSPSSTN